jgi:hypothetical protein
MYHTYNVDARNLLLFFFEKYFKDHEDLVTPIYPMEVEMDRERLSRIFNGGRIRRTTRYSLKKSGN